MASSPNDDSIGSKTRKFLRSLLSRDGTADKTPADEGPKEVSQPKVETPQEPAQEPVREAAVVDEDKPIYGARSTRPHIPNPLGG